jgi:hypothetical protein
MDGCKHGGLLDFTCNVCRVKRISIFRVCGGYACPCLVSMICFTTHVVHHLRVEVWKHTRN